MLRRVRAVIAAFREAGNPTEDRYGDDRTYHPSGEVNVEIGPGGHVVAVWFRCRMLPWTESRVDACRRADLRQADRDDLPPIKAIVFEEKP